MYPISRKKSINVHTYLYKVVEFCYNTILLVKLFWLQAIDIFSKEEKICNATVSSLTNKNDVAQQNGSIKYLNSKDTHNLIFSYVSLSWFHNIYLMQYQNLDHSCSSTQNCFQKILFKYLSPINISFRTPTFISLLCYTTWDGQHCHLYPYPILCFHQHKLAAECCHES